MSNMNYSLCLPYVIWMVVCIHTYGEYAYILWVIWLHLIDIEIVCYAESDLQSTSNFLEFSSSLFYLKGFYHTSYSQHGSNMLAQMNLIKIKRKLAPFNDKF